MKDQAVVPHPDFPVRVSGESEAQDDAPVTDL